GLPEGATPDVEIRDWAGNVVDPDHYHCMPTGQYEVIAREVVVDGQVWTPDLTGRTEDAAPEARLTLHLDPDHTELVQVRYANYKGWFNVQAKQRHPNGLELDMEQPVNIHVTGPFGFSQKIDGTH